MDVNLSGNVVAAVATTTGSGTNTAGVGAGNSGAGTGDQSASGTVVASSAVTISAAGTDAANASVAATSTGTDPSVAGTPSGTTPAGTTTGATSGTPSDTAATKLKHAVAHINSSLKTDGQSVEFSIDQSSKRTVVKVVDTTTNQVIQQMPTEEVLQMAKVLSEKSGSGSVSGSLINQQA